MSNLVHVCAHYKCGPDEVFVWTKRADSDWQKRTAAGAPPDRIIRCHRCDKPARRLDHHYPHMSEYNACEEHMGVQP